jgi:hypothetical protein
MLGVWRIWEGGVILVAVGRWDHGGVVGGVGWEAELVAAASLCYVRQRRVRTESGSRGIIQGSATMIYRVKLHLRICLVASSNDNEVGGWLRGSSGCVDREMKRLRELANDLLRSREERK